MVYLNGQLPPSFSERVSASAVKQAGIRDSVYVPYEFPGIVVYGVVAFLEFVQLFQYGNRNNKVILLKVINRIIIVEDDIGVQYEYFRRFGCLLKHLYFCILFFWHHFLPFIKSSVHGVTL